LENDTEPTFLLVKSLHPKENSLEVPQSIAIHINTFGNVYTGLKIM